MLRRPRERLDEISQPAKHFVATIEDDQADTKAVELAYEMIDGQSVLQTVTIRKQAGVVSRDLRIPLDYYQDVVAQHPARIVPSREQRRRRTMTDEFLQRVADAYVAGGRMVAGLKAQDSEFLASDSQVFRWLKAARERGILTEENNDGEH